LRNFQRGIEQYSRDIELVQSEDEGDLLFAFSPTTVEGEMIRRYKEAGKPFVLRMDGIPEDNRNSGKGTRRLIEFAMNADLIIYQTNFVRDTVGKIIKNHGVTCRTEVIHNGVDCQVYTPEGDKIDYDREQNKIVIAHMAYRKDNNKRYEEVLQMYRTLWADRQNIKLILIGRYPTEWEDYNMGFFAGERFERIGIVPDEAKKAMVLRSCNYFFYPSYADPAPNAVLEAMACGLPVMYQSYGGAKELIGPAGIPISGDYTFDFSAMLMNLPQLSERARNRAREFDLPAMSLQYEMALVDAFNRKKGVS